MCVLILFTFPYVYMCTTMHRVPWMVMRTSSLIVPSLRYWGRVSHWTQNSSLNWTSQPAFSKELLSVSLKPWDYRQNATLTSFLSKSQHDLCWLISATLFFFFFNVLLGMELMAWGKSGKFYPNNYILRLIFVVCRDLKFGVLQFVIVFKVSIANITNIILSVGHQFTSTQELSFISSSVQEKNL